MSLTNVIDLGFESSDSSGCEDNMIDLDDLTETVIDLSLHTKTRIKAFELHIKKVGDNGIDLMSNVTGMYQFSGSRVIQKFLYRLCTHGNISAFLKLEAAKSLLSFEEEEDANNKNIELVKKRNLDRLTLGYKALDYVCYDLTDPTPCRVDAVCMLMESPDHIKESGMYFREMISDKRIDCDYRYKMILSLEKRNNILNKEDHIDKVCMEFLFLKENETMYRILAAQKLLQGGHLDEEKIKKVCETVIEFATNKDLNYNLRADAADLLLGLGTEEMKIEGRKIINELGSVMGDVKTVFDNAQNVHSENIEKSTIEMLEYLISIPIVEVDKNPITYEQVRVEIIKLMKQDINTSGVHLDRCMDHCICCGACLPPDTDMLCSDICRRNNTVHIALNRIAMDRCLYSHLNYTLSKILIGVWSFIVTNEYSEELKKRLIEELYDMSGTCSSGFAARLVNVMSGFGEFNMSISWGDQITANFVGRLNALARRITDTDSVFYHSKLRDVVELWLSARPDAMKSFKAYHDYERAIASKDPNQTAIRWSETMSLMVDEFISNEESVDMCMDDFAEAVINEMTISTSEWDSRKNFLLFFRSGMLQIREEMYDEFKEHISDSDFDMYFRSAIITYEGEN